MLETKPQDLPYAVRKLRQNLTFTIAARAWLLSRVAGR